MLAAADEEVARLRTTTSQTQAVDNMQMQERLGVAERVTREMQDAHRDQLGRMSAELDEAERAHLREQETVANLKMELS